MADDPLRLLSIGAHPADVFDQSGGTMAHHAKKGDWVGCVVLTHGARVHDKVISNDLFKSERVPEAGDLERMMEERAQIKKEEVRKACGILGFGNIHFFDEDDRFLMRTEENVTRLARLIRQLKPDIVLTHFPREGDTFTNAHATAGQITLNAIDLATGVDPGDASPPHRVAQTFFFGEGGAPLPSSVWDAQGGYYNEVFIDISDCVEQKLASLDCLVSQGYGGAYARKRIETSDGSFGMSGHVPYAEAFIRNSSETHYYLPLTDYALQLARSSDHEIIERSSVRIKVD